MNKPHAFLLALLTLSSLAVLGLLNAADGSIDSGDAVYSRLRLWQDVNHNGVSEPSELHGLSDLGVAVLHLDYKESKHTDEHGNRFRYRAKLNDAPGARVSRWAWDVFLVTAR